MNQRIAEKIKKMVDNNDVTEFMVDMTAVSYFKRGTTLHVNSRLATEVEAMFKTKMKHENPSESVDDMAKASENIAATGTTMKEVSETFSKKKNKWSKSHESRK